MTKSKDIGTRAETAVVKCAQAHGFPNAERLALRGALDVGDVRLTPSVHLEVKAGMQASWPSPHQVRLWRKEAAAEARNAGAGIDCYLVTKLARSANPLEWPVHLSLAEYSRLVGCDDDPHPHPHPDVHVLRLDFGVLLTLIHTARAVAGPDLTRRVNTTDLESESNE